MAKETLSILIVGPDAHTILNMPEMDGLISTGDTVTIGDTKADVVIGTNCIRTYPSTIGFLTKLLTKIRTDKKTLKAPDAIKPVKKKKASKKTQDSVEKKSHPFLEDPNFDQVAGTLSNTSLVDAKSMLTENDNSFLKDVTMFVSAKSGVEDEKL